MDSNPPKASFNEYNWKHFSLRWGGGFLYDYSTYAQDDASEEQMDISPLDDLRDFRVLLKGKLPIPRVTYTLGYMYDKAKDDWRFRQTGLMVEIRKAHGNLFVGRTKEGFSTSKIMVGYQGWTNERATINDALISILADGIKWTGDIPNGKFVYNVGYFWNNRAEEESFDKHDDVVAARGVWLPLAGTDKGVLHIALQARHARSDQGELQYRSKPESFQAQAYAIDTGKFAADSADAYGFETYYRPGPFMVGTEYFFTTVDAPDSGNPFFHGGEVLVAHILTGETRPYNAKGAFFDRVSPSRSVFRWRARRLGIGRSLLVQRHGRRADPRWKVLADHADGQLAHVEQHAARVRVRLQLARSLRRGWQDALLPDPASAAAVAVRAVFGSA